MKSESCCRLAWSLKPFVSGILPKPPLKGYLGVVCFSKLKVAFYALIDGASGILNA